MATLLTLDHFQDVPEVRLLSSTGITRFRWYYEPVRHPTRPGLSLAGFRLGVTPPTAGVSRVATEICPGMPSPLPRRDRGGCWSLDTPCDVSLRRSKPARLPH